MRILIGLMLSLISTAMFIGCAQETVGNDKFQTSDTPTELYKWHDGSKGGVYGIGTGWSIELLAAQYGHDVLQYGDGYPVDVKLIPTEYEWVKDDNVGLRHNLEMETILVKIPAEYKTATKKVVLERAKTEYHFLDAKYNSNGSVLSPKTIGQREIPAVTNSVTVQVIKTPARTLERRVPIKRKGGFKRVVKTPAKLVSSKTSAKKNTITVPIVIEPWKFIIKNPDGQVVHSFEDFDKLKVFINTVK